MEKLTYEEALELVDVRLKACSGKLSRYGVPKEDLYQEGALAVMEAVDRFDPSRGVKFITFVYTRIPMSMLEYIRAKRDMVPVGRDKEPIETCLSETAVGLAVDSFNLQSHVIDTIDGDSSMLELKRMLGFLKERQLAVITELFFRKSTIEAAAEKFGVSKSRIFQIRNESLLKMRKVGHINEFVF
jgi:RNA polymerase sigma factor (sigma-70 family)